MAGVRASWIEYLTLSTLESLTTFAAINNIANAGYKKKIRRLEKKIEKSEFELKQIIDSTFSEKLHLNEIRLTKAHCGKPIVVWVIGAWNLEIFCYLFFEAWKFLITEAQQ